MDDPTTIFNGWMQFANVAAWIVIAVMFMYGQIFSSKAVDKILEHSKEITLKVSEEIATKIETAVENGVIRAYSKMDESKSSGD